MKKFIVMMQIFSLLSLPVVADDNYSDDDYSSSSSSSKGGRNGDVDLNNPDWQDQATDNDPSGKGIDLKIDYPTEDHKVGTIIEDLIEKHVQYNRTYDIKLPLSAFADQGEIIVIDDLFRAPDSGELDTLLFEEDPDTGKRKIKKLTKEQIMETKLKGIYRMPSKLFPGQDYVWQWRTFWQKGSEKIQVTFKKDVKTGLTHLIVSLPERLWGEKFSVAQGLSNIVKGIFFAFSDFFGTVETTSAYEIKSSLIKNGYVKLYDRLAIRDQIRSLQKDSILKELTTGDSLSDVTTPDGKKVDLRVYDQDIMSKATKIISGIYKEIQDDSYIKRVVDENKLRELFIEEGMTDLDAINQKIVDTISLRDQALFMERISSSEELEKLSPGLSQKLIDQAKATLIVYEQERLLQLELDQYSAQMDAKLKAQNPYKYEIESWRSEKLQKLNKEFYLEIRADFYKGIITILEDEGLEQQAYFVKKNLEFLTSKKQEILKAVKEIKEAADVKYTERKLLPRSWYAEKVGNGKNDYELIKSTYLQAKTSTPGWRAQLWLNRTAAWTWNIAYVMGGWNITHGPFGLKSMFDFKNDKFSWEREMKRDEKGNIMFDEKGKPILQPDSYKTWGTYKGRLKNIWQYARKLDERFDAKPATSFGEITKFFQRTYSYLGVRGFWGIGVVGIGQPIATVINPIVSTAVAGTSFVWAPMAASLVHLFNYAIYDADKPRRVAGSRWSPLINNLLVKTVIKGGGQAVTGIGVSLYHSVMGVSAYGVAHLRKIARTTWDMGVRNILIKTMGRQQIDNGSEFTVKRIAGPDRLNDYFYQIKPNLALIALRAKLEELELRNYERVTTADIKAPLKRFFKLLEEQFSPTLGNLSGGKFEKYLGQVQTNQLIDLREALTPRQAKIRELNNFPVSDMIRLKQEDLKYVLNEGQKYVKEYYMQKVFINMDEKQIARFWADMEVAPNDWLQLTAKTLKQTFSPNIIQSIEELDKVLMLEIDDTRIRDIARAVLKGNPAAEIPEIEVTKYFDVKQSTMPEPTQRALNADSFNFKTENLDESLSRRFEVEPIGSIDILNMRPLNKTDKKCLGLLAELAKQAK